MTSITSRFSTHEVQNQPSPMPGINAWLSDQPLREAVGLNGGAWAGEQLARHGALAGGELMAQGDLANRHRPELRCFDRHGRRIDDVAFPPGLSRADGPSDAQRGAQLLLAA